MPKTPESKLQANARYQKKLVSFVARRKEDDEEGQLLIRAKASGDLQDKFWAWLKKEFGEKN